MLVPKQPKNEMYMLAWDANKDKTIGQIKESDDYCLMDGYGWWDCFEACRDLIKQKEYEKNV